MFKMPAGKQIDDDGKPFGLDINEFGFNYGLVSHYRPNARNPCGHRLVKDGVVVGWLVESPEGGRRYLAGDEGRRGLARLDREVELRHRAWEWSEDEFSKVGTLFVEAFSAEALLDRTLYNPSLSDVLSGRDLANLVIEALDNPAVMGAFAFEKGLLINSGGELPDEAEKLAIFCQGQIDGLDELSNDLATTSIDRNIVWFDEGVLLLARADEATLALWTNHGANHHVLLSNLLTSLKGTPLAPLQEGESAQIPEGFVVEELNGGVDKVISMLSKAKETSLTGHLQATTTEGETHHLLLVKGILGGYQTTNEMEFDEFINLFTASSNRLTLQRVDKAGELASSLAASPPFSLENLVGELVTTRTRSAARKNILEGKLDRIFGFHIALEKMTEARASWKLTTSGSEGSTQIEPVEREGAVLLPIAESERKLEIAEAKRIEAERERNRLNRMVDEAKLVHEADLLVADSMRERISELEGELQETGHELDERVIQSRELEVERDDSDARATKLSTRLAETENLLSQRIDELAQAVGDFETSEELRANLEMLAENEGSLKVEIVSAEERLRQLRQSIDSDERKSRTLTEQTSELNLNHRRIEAEKREVEQILEIKKLELAESENELKGLRISIRDEEERNLLTEQRYIHLQSELTRLMEERRDLLRDLGDLEAKRSSQEVELTTLINQTQELQSAHDEAVDDIQEAERIRARLMEEPLGQALIGTDHGFAALTPIITRMDEARQRGYSVVLLDRAVERGLAIIRQTVDEVSSTPRHLLSREVMELLEHQSPDTAEAVRGLTRWSVQNRLQHRLGEVVEAVVVELEGLLDEYDESVTMLRRLRGMLVELAELGMAEEELHLLESVSNRPEILPKLAQEVKRRVDSVLADIYLDSDKKDPGEVVHDPTIEVLEGLLTHLEESGLLSSEPKGMLWELQRTGVLSFEEHLIEVNGSAIMVDSLEELNPIPPTLTPTESDNESKSDLEEGVSGWKPLPEVEDEAPVTRDDGIERLIPIEEAVIDDDVGEMARIESAINDLDERYRTRGKRIISKKTTLEDDEVASLDEELSHLDL